MTDGLAFICVDFMLDGTCPPLVIGRMSKHISKLISNAVTSFLLVSSTHNAVLWKRSSRWLGITVVEGVTL